MNHAIKSPSKSRHGTQLPIPTPPSITVLNFQNQKLSEPEVLTDFKRVPKIAGPLARVRFFHPNFVLYFTDMHHPSFSHRLLTLAAVLLCLLPQRMHAQTLESAANDNQLVPITVDTPDTYYRAKVIKILESGDIDVDGVSQFHQKLQLEIVNGNEKGKKIIIDHGATFAIQEYQHVTEGETVVINKPGSSPTPDFYYITDKYRLPNVLILVALFFALAIFFGRKRGLTSIIGLIFTTGVIFWFLIPRIAGGHPPLTAAIIAALAITFLSLYLSHGFNRRTSIAMVSTLLALGAAIVMDLAFVYFAKLSGTGSEEAFYLQIGTGTIDLRGVLLAGILIGVLGVLDDVTTGQAAAVEEIYTANPNVSMAQLYKSGLSVGREHIASLVNTLVLAYVGASFPLLLLYSMQKSTEAWVTLNSNFIAEELIRTLVGSSVLVLAVPLTTILASWWMTRKNHV